MNSPYQSFLQHHDLPEDYTDIILPRMAAVLEDIHDTISKTGQVFVLGINGCQGSGKSTLASFLKVALKKKYDISSAVMSLDDFYLTRQKRISLATDIHPLLAKRGVPGTHDIAMAINTIEQLKDRAPTYIPVFDKSIDDRAPKPDWQYIDKPVDVVIIEGWCIGAQPQGNKDILKDANALESEHDKDGSWRRYVNQRLANEYQDLFAMIDKLLMLAAPAFDCVYQWRVEQEHKLAKKLQSTSEERHIMTDEEIYVFIQYFQRLTEHMLTSMPAYVDYLFRMDEKRHFIDTHLKK